MKIDVDLIWLRGGVLKGSYGKKRALTPADSFPNFMSIELTQGC
jgi:hypothetical protein